jgi:hypothetical protein
LKQNEYYYCYDRTISVSEKAEKLIKSLKESVNKFKKEIKIKEKDNNKWFNPKLKELKEKRDEAYKTAQNTNDTELWSNYKQIRNKYSKMIKREYNNYTKKSIIECKGDSKMMWRKIKELTKEKEIEINGKRNCRSERSGRKFE